MKILESFRARLLARLEANSERALGISVRLTVHSILAAANDIAFRRRASEGKRRKGPCKRRGGEEGQREVLHVDDRERNDNDQKMANELIDKVWLVAVNYVENLDEGMLE